MKKIKKLTVYLGSSGRCRDIFKDTAKNFGTLVGQSGIELVYGGMDTGLMGIVANNALAAGGRVTGIIPKNLKDSERIHPKLSQTILVPDLWERKLKMFKRAEAIVVLPGGFGTIDEALEALYWASLGSHKKPIIFVNTDNYWDKFIQFMKAADDLEHDLLLIAPTEADVFDLIHNWHSDRPIKDPNFLPNFESEILAQDDAPLIISEPSIQESYKLATALGLKQLAKHKHHIGILNACGGFNSFLEWVNVAEKEHFITDRCKKLFNFATTPNDLNTLLERQEEFTINLDQEKWGPSVTGTHIEIKETD